MTNEIPKEIHVHRIIEGGESYLKAYYEPSSLDRLGIHYTRLDPDDIVISRAELEGMRHSEEEMDKEADCEVSFYSMGGYNDLIEELLARIK